MNLEILGYGKSPKDGKNYSSQDMKDARASRNARIIIVTPLKICVLWRNAIFIQRANDLYSKQRAKQKKESGL